MNAPAQAIYFVNLWPEPQSSAAGVRTHEISHFIQRLGYQVIGVAPGAMSQHSEAWEKTGVTTLSCDPNSSAATENLKTLSPDVVIYDRFYTEEKYGWRARELWPDALHVIDTSDLHCLRGARQKALAAGQDVGVGTIVPHDDFFDEEFLREMASLHRADVCLVVSKFEAEWLERQGFEKKRVCHLPFSSKADAVLKPQTDRRGYCFLGNYRHAPNVDAVRWLASELWPVLRKSLPSAELHLYGAYPTQAISQLHGRNGIFSHGFVENHRQAIAHHQVLLAPLRFGAGIKGKVLEAWATGTPVLGTPLAFESMGSGFPEFTDAAGFVDQIFNLQTPKCWDENVERGLRQLENDFAREAIFNTFTEFVASSRKHLPEIRKSLTGRLLRHHGAQSLKYFSLWIEEKNRYRNSADASGINPAVSH